MYLDQRGAWAMLIVPTWFGEKKVGRGAPANVQNASWSGFRFVDSCHLALGSSPESCALTSLFLRISPFATSQIRISKRATVTTFILHHNKYNHGYNQRLDLVLCRTVAASHTVTSCAS
jgi:hypothetical protein